MAASAEKASSARKLVLAITADLLQMHLACNEAQHHMQQHHVSVLIAGGLLVFAATLFHMINL